MRNISILLVIIFSQSVCATTWDQLSIKDIYKKSEVVAIVSIESGSMIYSSGNACGARYKSKVSNQFKGDPSSEIVFYDFGGMEIGGKYLLFLAEDSLPFLGVATTNSDFVSWQHEFTKNCMSVRKGLQPFRAYGSIKVDFSIEVHDEALEVPEMLFSFPESVERHKGDPSQTQELYDTVWIKLEDAVDYLVSIAKPVPVVPG